MPVSKYALLGLNADYCIVWCSNDEHATRIDSIPIDAIRGKHIAEAFPQFSIPLESGRWVQLGTNRGCARTLDIRDQGEGYQGVEWIVQFTPALLSARIDEATKAARLIQDARSNLMTEFHQSGQQILSALLLRLGAMGTAATEEEMQEIRNLATSAQTEMRTLTRTVVPIALATEGLGAALAVLAETLRERGTATLMVPEDNGRRFPEVVEICAYEAIRGLLSRVSTLKLTQASASLHATPTTLRVIVELDILATEAQLGPSDYVRELLSRTLATQTTEVGSSETTVVLEFPLGVTP